MNDSIIFVIIGKNDDSYLEKNKKINHVDHTEDRVQLAQWYLLADVFVNPTIGDNFPTVNLESLACGTPVVSFDTGGCAKSVADCGYIVPRGDTDGLVNAINKCIENNISPPKCVRGAKNHDKLERYQEYITLYESNLKK